MSNRINEEFNMLCQMYPAVKKLSKFWLVQNAFSTQSMHMLFLIKFYIIKQVYAVHQKQPGPDLKNFITSLAKDLHEIKKNIAGNNHTEKMEKIRSSVLSFFGNCQEIYEKNMMSATLAQK